MRALVWAGLMGLASCSTAGRELAKPDAFHLGYGLGWGESSGHWGPGQDTARVLQDTDTDVQAVSAGLSWSLTRDKSDDTLRELRAIRAGLEERCQGSGSTEIVQPGASCEADSEPEPVSAWKERLRTVGKVLLVLFGVIGLGASAAFVRGLVDGQKPR